MLNCKCVPNDDIRPLTYHLVLLIWVNAWSWPSSDPNFWLFDVETCPITRFDTHSRWGGGKGLSVWNKKKNPSSSCHPTRNSSSFRLISFPFSSSFLINFFSFGDVRRCHAVWCLVPAQQRLLRFYISFWKPLKLIGIRTGKTRQTIDTNWPSRWCSVNWNGSAHERDTKPPWPAHVVAAG